MTKQAKTKLSPLMQWAIDRMAKEGAEIVSCPYTWVYIRKTVNGERVAGNGITKNTINALLKRKLIHATPYVVASFETVYRLTDAGRKLAKPAQAPKGDKSDG